MKIIILSLLAVLPSLHATVLTLGTNSFADGASASSGVFTGAAETAKPPFNTIFGGDSTANASFSWTFTFVAPVDPVTSASLLVSLWDVDSAASGNQIGSFTLNGVVDLTALLNAASEAANASSGRFTYLTIVLPNAAFAQIQTGTATFALSFAAPGNTITGESTFNGGGADFSQLTFDTTPVGPPVPEPSTLALSAGAVLALGWFRRRR